MATGKIINPLESLKKTLNLDSANVTSDTFILGLPVGVYQIASASSISYLPTTYGTLILLRSGGQYGVAVVVPSNANGLWIRHFTNTTWHYAWQHIT